MRTSRLGPHPYLKEPIVSDSQPPQQPYGQPAPGQQPYPPQGYQQAPPKKKHTLRNVLLILALVFILFVGGCLALIGGAANEIDKSIKEDANKAGGTDNPLTIKEGEAFEVDGFKYSAGWAVDKDQFGFIKITGLKVTNDRDDKDSALVEIKFWNGSEVLASDDCTTSPIDVGTTVTLNCLGLDELPKSYDKITINDSF